MAVHSIIPNTNVSFNDIRDTLNANGGSVTNDIATAFQSRAKINVWSKHKPVRFKGDFPDLKSYWYRGNDILHPCGLNITFLDNDKREITIGNIKNATSWDTYTLYPSGGSEQPFRLGDFRGYNTGAVSPIDVTVPSDSIIYIGNIRPERYNVFFSAYVTNDPLDYPFISIIDLCQCFNASSAPVTGMGILGLIAIKYDGTFYVKSINLNNEPIPLINAGALSGEEDSFINYFKNQSSVMLVPVICNKVFSKWTRNDQLGYGFQAVLMPKKGRNVFEYVEYRDYISPPPPTNYIVRAYVYGSNFTTPFSPLENPVTYNGLNSELSVELEIILSSGVQTGRIPYVGYEFNTPFGIRINETSPIVSGGHWAKVSYNGTQRDCYRYSRYKIRKMYNSDSNGNTKPASGTVPVSWSFLSYSVEGSFYMYLTT